MNISLLIKISLAMIALLTSGCLKNPLGERGPLVKYYCLASYLPPEFTIELTRATPLPPNATFVFSAGNIVGAEEMAPRAGACIRPDDPAYSKSTTTISEDRKNITIRFNLFEIENFASIDFIDLHVFTQADCESTDVIEETVYTGVEIKWVERVSLDSQCPTYGNDANAQIVDLD